MPKLGPNLGLNVPIIIEDFLLHIKGGEPLIKTLMINLKVRFHISIQDLKAVNL